MIGKDLKTSAVLVLALLFMAQVVDILAPASNAPSAKQSLMACLLGGLIALRITRTSFFTRSRRTTARKFRINRQLDSLLRQDLPAFQILFNILREQYGVTYANIIRLKSEEEAEVIAASAGDEEMPQPGTICPLEQSPRQQFWRGHSYRCMKERRPVIVEDSCADIAFLRWRTVARAHGRIVTLPILANNQANAVLNILLNKEERISSAYLEEFQNLANFVSVEAASFAFQSEEEDTELTLSA